jgi:hypothetical protein
MADIAFVKGQTPAGDRVWMTMADGTSHRVAVQVSHDMPHLVVESLFGLDDGLWGILARGGFSPANRAATARGSRRARLVTDAEFDELAARNWRGHRVAKAAANAVANRWQDGPDTPGGVRTRMAGAGLRERDKRASRPADLDAEEHLRRMRELAESLDDDTIQLAIDGVRHLFRSWADLPAGGVLRLRWPLSRGRAGVLDPGLGLA